METIQSLSLDLHNTQYKYVTCKQYDTRDIFKIEIWDGGKQVVLSDLDIKVRVYTPDKRCLLLTSDYVSKSNNIVTVNVPQSVLLCDGKANCEVALYNGNQRLTSMTFVVIIVPSVYSESDVLSDPDKLSETTEIIKECEEQADKAESSATLASEYADAASESAANAKVSETNSKSSETSALSSSNLAKGYCGAAEKSAENAETYATNAEESAQSAENIANDSKSYAVGTGGTVREGDDTDNSKYYYEQTKAIASLIYQGGIIPRGTITFEELESQEKKLGYMYNISNDFISTDDFKDGAGHYYSAGTNVYYTSDGYWDCLVSIQDAISIETIDSWNLF